MLVVVTASDICQEFGSQAQGALKCDRKQGENVQKTGKGGKAAHEFQRLGLHWMRQKARLSLRVAKVRWQMISDKMQGLILQAAVVVTTRSINWNSSYRQHSGCPVPSSCVLLRAMRVPWRFVRRWGGNLYFHPLKIFGISERDSSQLRIEERASSKLTGNS